MESKNWVKREIKRLNVLAELFNKRMEEGITV
jgi:hypothetical protein